MSTYFCVCRHCAITRRGARIQQIAASVSKNRESRQTITSATVKNRPDRRFPRRLPARSRARIGVIQPSAAH